jgi:hypothetical protein
METANTFNAETFLALGAAGIAILLLGTVLVIAIMAWSLQLSIRWIGNRTPGFLASLGWIIAIGFVNLFIVSVGYSALGPAGSLLATPLTWGVTIFMLASAGDCGLLRGFGIWIAQSFLSGIGVFLVMLATAIPFAMLGAGMQSIDGNLQTQFDQIDSMLDDTEAFSEDSFSGPQPTPVGFPAGEGTNPWFSDDEAGGSDTAAPVPSAGDDAASETVPATPFPVPPAPSPAPAPRLRESPPSASPRRAADGSMLNPFFDQ